MNEHETARARSLGYGLLADLLANGVTSRTREAALASVPMARALEGVDGDTLGVQIERAFGWAAPPFEGAYLDADGTIGGAGTDSLWALFRACGFHPDVRSVDVEHLCTALRALAFTSGAEADAIEDGHRGAVERTRELARRLLDEHVLRWLPLWASAVRRAEQSFPSALADQIEELALSHRGALPGQPLAFELPAIPGLLDDERTGLRDIGAWLSKPALSGIVLTRVDIERVGRDMEIPRGFGTRAQLLETLMRSAARFEVFERSIDTLETELDAQVEALRGARYDGVRELLRTWTGRAAQTRQALRRIAESALGRDD